MDFYALLTDIDIFLLHYTYDYYTYYYQLHSVKHVQDFCICDTANFKIPVLVSRAETGSSGLMIF